MTKVSYSLNTLFNSLSNYYSNCAPKLGDIGTGTPWWRVQYEYQPVQVIQQDWNTFISTIPDTFKKGYSTYPKTNHYIIENGTNVLAFAATGFCKKEISIKVENGVLIIEAKSQRKEADGVTRYLNRDIAQRDWEERWALPEEIDAAKITSRLEEGILYIFMPIKEEIAKNNVTITVE